MEVGICMKGKNTTYIQITQKNLNERGLAQNMMMVGFELR